MSKVKAPNPADVLRLGAQTATIKASMPAKRWARFVKLAHARGHTVGGELSNEPNALKERTAASLRAEAQKTVSTAYAPAQKELSTREKAIGYLDEKRKTDDAAYRTWLTGETDKLNAQARAADATLATQQSTIADETKTAIAAARADSLQRMTAASSVSDPTQSTALDTSAADTAATQHIAAARDQSAAIAKIGGDSRELASASVLAQQAARESSRQGDTLKALADLNTDKLKLSSDKATALTSATTDLLNRNVTIAQSNREADLAADSLGVKKASIEQTIAEANRKYKLETAKFGLDKWKAAHADDVAKAETQLGYDKIASTEGIAAANRKLNEKLAKIRASQQSKAAKDKKKGVTSDERDLYSKVHTAQGLIERWHANGRVAPQDIRQTLRAQYGVSDAVIDVANDLWAHNGQISPAGAAAARKLGVRHVGYFWDALAATGTGNPAALNGLG